MESAGLFFFLSISFLYYGRELQEESLSHFFFFLIYQVGKNLTIEIEATFLNIKL